MQIERIHDYTDNRFPQEVLWEHGAFLIDGARPCAFKICGPNAASVFFDDDTNISEIIDVFRDYAEHITVFYDADRRIIAEYPPVLLQRASLQSIQPSQFFLDIDKVEAVSHFIRNSDDVIVPVVRDPQSGRWVSLDGHSRMYAAAAQGWQTVQVYESKAGAYIWDFAKEAQRRGVWSPKDILPLQHQDYQEQWFGFCSDYFARNP